MASGKGGTGKTLLSSCLARMLDTDELIIMDTDVEEPNTHLVLPHHLIETRPVTRAIPSVNMDLCTLCGKCAEVCNFNAIVVLPEKVLVFSELCHSCGACSYLCPEKAIVEEGQYTGDIEYAELPGKGRLITGCLAVGEAMSPPLIKAVKEEAKHEKYTIVDCPPGTTCPMVEAIQGSDYCLMVTEPTPFGVHDLELSLEAAKMLGITCGLVINRWQGDDKEIQRLAEKNEIPILGRIPFSMELAKAYARGDNPLEALPELKDTLLKIITVLKIACAVKENVS
ncbi:MAG: ATP-binding protein [Bacillota bacterium]|nr:ATP-binding protein [Bacillota bacterium]